MNSLYPQQKKNRDSFKDNIDSDEDKDNYESLNSQENNINGKEEESPENSPYVMTIEIDKGISEKLQIFYDSIPEEVAYEFCKKHNLDYTALNYLIQEIKNVLSQNPNEDKKENEPILEEEEESVGSEGNTKKELKIEDNNISSNRINMGENFSSNMNVDCKVINKQIQDENIKFESTNNCVNQSTNLNEGNHTEMNFNTTGQNTYDIQHIVMNTESTFKDSFNDIYKQTNSTSNRVSAKKNDKYKITKEKGTNSFEQKLFSYQIFIDKYNTSKNNSNTNSNKKSMKNSSTNISVFDKLYNDSKQRRHQQIQVSHSYNPETNISKDHLSTILGNKFNKHILNLINKPTNPVRIKTNIGENLYNKGINLKKNFECKLSFLRKEEMQKNKDLYTYKPNLMKKSIKSSNNLTDEDVNVLTRFENYKREKDFEMRQLRELHEDKGNYSFVPKINENSENIVKNKYLSMANEDETMKNKPLKVQKNFELYELSRLKHLKMKNLELQHYGDLNFMPNVNSNNKVYSDFKTRQETYMKIKSEKQLKLKEEFDDLIDRKTGQHYFKPKLGKNTVNRNHTNIYEHLYTQSGIKKEKIQYRNKQYLTEIQSESKKKLTDENTENIFLQKKIDLYKKLFKLLDFDEDGEISIFCIDLRKIPSKLVQILQPIIFQMKEWGNKYKERQFIIECEKLYSVNNLLKKKINFEEKKSFLSLINSNSKRSKSLKENCFSFQPEINNYSRILDQSRNTRSNSRVFSKTSYSTEKSAKKSKCIFSINEERKLTIE